MIKIRLMRIGSKKRPFYRVVAVDERKKRTGSYLELLGTYNPLTEPKEVNLKQDLIDKWLKFGAVPSEGFLRVIGKAPQRPPRKPKKAKREEAKPAGEVAEEAKSDIKEVISEVESEISETQSEQPLTEQSGGSNTDKPTVSEPEQAEAK